MNVKKDNTFLWRVHAKRVTSVNAIEQHLSMHLFKARTDFSVEPQSILNKRSDNVYLCLLSSFYTLFITEYSTSFVSPYSNNAFKTPSTSGTIDVSNEGGAILMPQNKLTIVPVTLDSLSNVISLQNPLQNAEPSCVIKTAIAEITFYNSVDERINQTIMRELNS